MEPRRQFVIIEDFNRRLRCNFFYFFATRDVSNLLYTGCDSLSGNRLREETCVMMLKSGKEKRMNRRMMLLAGLIGWALLSAPAFADTIWKEKGDAGDLPATAQETAGNGNLDQILGKIDSRNDVDLFCIKINDPTNFLATTVGTKGTLADTQLFLFDPKGMGLLAADDTATSLRSQLSAAGTGVTLTKGEYLLGISAFDADPLSKSGYIFSNTKFINTQTATGPGGSDPVIKWSTTGFDSGTYTINLTGATPCVAAVPEGSSWLIYSVCGAMLLGVGFLKRRSTLLRLPKA